MTRALALALALLLLLPFTSQARADTTIQVANGESLHYPNRPIENPFSDAYHFALAPSHFGDNLSALSVQVHQDYGEMGAGGFYLGPDGRLVHRHVTTYEIANATKVVTVAFENLLTQNGIRQLNVVQNVYVDGQRAWTSRYGDLAFGSLDYRANTILAWNSDNTHAAEPWGGILGVSQSLSTDSVRFPATYWPGGTLFFVEMYDDEEYWSGKANGTATGCSGFCETKAYHLANISHVESVSVYTDFDRQEPQKLQLRYRFETKSDREARAADLENACPGLKGAVRNFLGFCPTLENIVGRVADGTGDLVGRLLGSVPGLEDIGQDVGVIFGVVVGAYTFGLFLILLHPLELALVLFGHIVFYSLLIAAFQRDATIIISGIGSGTRGAGKFVYYYVFGTVYVAWMALQLGAQLFAAIGQWVRG